MRVKVLEAFRDKNKPSRVYQPGEVLEFDIERAAHMQQLGLVEYVVGRKPKKK